MAEQNDKKRCRSPSPEPEIDLPEVKKLREDLLDSFDDGEFCTENEDLDSFMKSFEDEISPAQLPPATSPAPVIELAVESDLGFLLEASDDELGLPPYIASPNQMQNEEGGELVRIPSDSSGLTELWEFEDHMRSFDSFEFVGTENLNGVSEYVAIDGLFDYSDMGFGPADLEWQPETLPAQ